VLYAFTGGADGYAPSGVIQASDGSVYGTTRQGGQAGNGTVFKIDQYGTLTTLHNFSGTDGMQPSAPLIQAQDGSFWGTASSGGPNGGGVVFRIAVANDDGAPLPARAIQGRVEAEDYDRGGPGVGYVDSRADCDQCATVAVGSVSLSAGPHIISVLMGPQDWMDFQ
jgi:uncharacterized repeat protein (TIGR03803 family)